MQLTPQDVKLLERLRKKERQWPRDRWILLVVGIFVFAGYIYILVLTYSKLDFQNLKSVDVLLFAVIWPKCLLIFLFATYFVVWAIRDWHGNANRRLVLRLLDEQLNGALGSN